MRSNYRSLSSQVSNMKIAMEKVAKSIMILITEIYSDKILE